MKKLNVDIFIEATRKWFSKYAGYGSIENAKAIIGISGGKDSSVVAAILKEALGADKVYGIMLPNGIQKDIQDSKDLISLLEINFFNVNINDAYTGLINCLDQKFIDIDKDPAVTTNLPARLRMSTLYAIANHINGRVIGTGNRAEIICGYYTLWGDGACDFDPIADLYVDEVIELGRQLGLPDRFILKTPDDGMSGLSDEDKLGFKYSDVKTFCETSYVALKEKLDQETFDRINHKIHFAQCKRNLTRIPFIKRSTGEIIFGENS